MQTTSAAQRRAAATVSLEKTLTGFGRLLEDRFRRFEPGELDRPLLVQAACEALAALGRKPIVVPADDGEDARVVLERFAAVNNLRLRRVNLRQGEGVEGDTPLIGFLSGNEPVALLPGKWGGMDIVDPACGARRRLAPEVAQRLARQAYALHPVLPAGKLALGTVMAFGLQQVWREIAAIVACGVAASLLAMATPLAIAQITDVAIQERDLQFLFEVAAALLFVLVTQACLHVGGQLAELRLEGRSALPLQAAMIDRMLRLPAAALRKTSTVMLATQMETAEKLRRSAVRCAVAALLALLHLLTAVALVTFYVPFAGLVALGAVCMLLVAAAAVGYRQYKAMYEGERMDVVVMAFVYDLVRLVPVIRAHRTEDRAFVQWAQNFLAYQARLQRSGRITNILAVVEAGWEILTLAACFAAVALAGAAGGIALGAAVAFVVTLGRLIAAGREMAQAVLGAAKLMPMAKMAKPILDQEVERAAPPAPLPQLRGTIQLVNVGFAYDGRAVLKGVNMTIPDGEFVGIVGPSGSGKSTLLRILLGLEAPPVGQVLFDGHDIRTLDRRQLSRQIGVVLQGGRLFSGSIFENIRGASDLTVEEAWEFAALAGIADELRDLPMGMQTPVGDDGSALAVGQVQRILLARALACRPRILILDEATSALDGPTQAKILESLAALPLTRIVVAHRPAALAGADRLLLLENGQMVEAGSADHPAGRPSRSAAPVA